MGLIKSLAGAVGGTLADQWREYFYCDSMPAEVLVEKGYKKESKRSSNTKGNENIISNGSVIAVNEGQCMLIVEQGKVVDFCAEAGEFVFDTSTEPSLFYGSLGENIKNTFKTIGKRFTFGGDTGKDQRVYYINTKEILGNKYGTPNPIPFRVVDQNVGLDIDVSIRCFGEYSYKIIDPLLFYTNVCGNVTNRYERALIDSMLKTELMTALQPAFAKISEMGIRYSALPGHTDDIAEALNSVLSEKWSEERGIKVASFGVSSVTAREEDEKMIKELQRNAAFKNPTMAAAHLVGAQAEAMQSAAKNEGAGPVMAFAGMNLAGQAGGSNVNDLYAAGKQADEKNIDRADKANEWTCSCGTKNVSNFCSSCGEKRPEDGFWICTQCDTKNKGKFCIDCGAKKPAGVKQYRCDKCGWEPEDKAKPPKFCPECGDKFDDADLEKE